MIEWLNKKYTDYKMKHRISKESCFVFPIIAKKMLEDGARYQTFEFTKTRNRFSNDYTWDMKITSAKWCSEKDCFLACSTFTSYEDFKPIRKLSWAGNEEYKHVILSYNPCDINTLDLEELKDITFNIGDDNVESDDIWEKLITYFDKRGLSD